MRENLRVNASAAALPGWMGSWARRSGEDAPEETAAPLPLSEAFGKVPEVAIGFWIIKIAATTLGETGGDALSMSLNLGYATSTIIFFALFAVAVGAQIRAQRFHAFLYWAVIVATTLTGTTMADFADRSLGIGYLGGSIILFTLVIAVLTTWRLKMGSISVECITSPKVEMFYWTTILFSNTLGTALGDWSLRIQAGLRRRRAYFCRVHRDCGADLLLHQDFACGSVLGGFCAHTAGGLQRSATC